MALQEAAAATVKEEDDDASDKGSESDEGEANKDSPSERDDDSDKQSDTEVDEMAGDDEEVRELSKQSRRATSSSDRCSLSVVRPVLTGCSPLVHVRSGRRCSRASSGGSERCWRPSPR